MRLMLKVCACLALATTLTGCCCLPGCYDGYYGGVYDSGYGMGHHGMGGHHGGHCGCKHHGGLFGCGLFSCLRAWRDCHCGGHGGYADPCCETGYGGYGPAYYPDAYGSMGVPSHGGDSYYVPGETVIPHEDSNAPQRRSGPSNERVPDPVPEPEMGPNAGIIPQSYMEPAYLPPQHHQSYQQHHYGGGMPTYAPRGSFAPAGPAFTPSTSMPIYGGKVIR